MPRKKKVVEPIKQIDLSMERVHFLCATHKFNDFENLVGQYFGIPATASKPKFIVTIKIEGNGDTD